MDDTEMNTSLMQVSTRGGETAHIPVSVRNPVAFDFSQGHSELLLGGGKFESFDRPLWVLPLPAGPPHRLSDIAAHDACWAPDGRHLAFISGKDIVLANADGSDARKLVSADGFINAFWIRFSPDGKRLRFSVFKPGATDATGHGTEMVRHNDATVFAGTAKTSVRQES